MKRPSRRHLLGLLLGLAALWGAPGAVAAPMVVPVELDMRAVIAAKRFDPARDAVGIRGSVAPLSWQQPVLARALGDGRYGLELRFEHLPFGGQPVQYKFRMERAGQGPDEGWEPGRNHALLLSVPHPRIARAFEAVAMPLPPQRTGHIEALGLVKSSHVPARGVQVWLPPGYELNVSRRYPVLYLHDGQTMFDAQAAGAEWQMDETAQRLALEGAIEPPIIVAIDSGRDRLLEYTPTAALLDAARGGSGPRQGGGAAAYARFLIEELKPMIDQRYRTRAGPASTAVGGASLGGLVSLWLALSHADTFGAALVVSPSVWWDDFYLRREVMRQPEHASRHVRVWLDMGALEGAQAMAEARRVHAALQARGWGGANLAYTEAAAGSHDELSWAARAEGMLRFLYGQPAALK